MTLETPDRLRWPEGFHGQRPRLPQTRGGTPAAEPEPQPESASEPGPEPAPPAPAPEAYDPVVHRRVSRRPGWRSGSGHTGLGVVVPIAILVAAAVALIAIHAGEQGATQAPELPAASTPTSTVPGADGSGAEGALGDPSAADASTSPGIGPDKLSTDLFPDVWQLRYGQVQLRAHRIRATDYPGCKQTLKPRVAAGGCRYSLRMTYRALHSRLRMTQLVYDFGTARAARSSADMLTADSTNTRHPDDAQLPDYKQGWFKADDYGKYVVFTMVTATADVPVETGKEFTTYGNRDLGAAILFRL